MVVKEVPKRSRASDVVEQMNSIHLIRILFPGYHSFVQKRLPCSEMYFCIASFAIWAAWLVAERGEGHAAQPVRVSDTL